MVWIDSEECEVMKWMSMVVLDDSRVGYCCVSVAIGWYGRRGVYVIELVLSDTRGRLMIGKLL